MTEKIAEFVTSLGNWGPDVAKQLFHMVPPYQGYEYVIASAAIPWVDRRPEVMLFGARQIEDGIYESSEDVAGPIRWTQDFKELFDEIEYEMVGGEELPELRPMNAEELGVEQEYLDKVQELSVSLDPTGLFKKYLDAQVVDEYVKPTDEDGLTEEQHNEIRDHGGGS